MSIQRDFLLKMIEMMGDLIAALLSKIKNGETKIAEAQLEQYYGDFLKHDAAFFRKIPAKELTMSLLHKHNFTNDHLHILAELFFAEGEVNRAKNNHVSAIEYLQKSLLLHEYLDESLKTFDLARQDKIAMLKTSIKSLL